MAEESVFQLREDWLGQVVEEAIDPGRPIIDPHFHFFEASDFLPKYGLADLQSDTRQHNVQHTIFMQCRENFRTTGPELLRPVGEMEWMARVAEEAKRGPADSFRIAALIGDAPLIQGSAVRELLEAHLAATPLVRGIRDMGLWDASPEVDKVDAATGLNMYGEPSFRKGFAELERLGLSFDAHQYHTQLPYVADLAGAFPGTTIIVNHLGSPLAAGPYANRREEVFVEWRKAIALVAACPNVFMKLGGLAMPWSGFGFDRAERPPTSDELVAVQGRYYDHAIQSFGPSRCMFESNFPVDKLSLGYTVLWNAFKKMARGYSQAEQDAMFRGTAARVYRLDV